ncbi:MAG: D-alanyl-D-alanine carboxypeptidase family protein [Acidimicrobiia bacterium]|nr:D-alanyl-D-alanine carboxypeptidase family protein [Acidimicrobiia bacterium]
MKTLVAVMVVLILGASAFPSDADLKDDLEKLEQEREQTQAQIEAASEQVNAATAEVDEVTAALAALNAQVNEQEAQLAAAEDKLNEAEARYAEATAAVKIKTAEIELLKDQVKNKAISAFVGRGGDANPIMEDIDPNEAVRRRSLVLSVTQQDLDITESLRTAQEELAIQQALADKAQADAAEFRNEMAGLLAQLQVSRDQQAELAAEAEARLDARLAEQAILEEHDKELAGKIKAANDELARQAALAAARAAASRNPASGGGGGSYPSADQIVRVQGFWVHVDIAQNLDAMLNKAAADGIFFGGWGYRDHQAQIRLRKSHCGTSNYAIWQMPASQCRPPTARPGASMHEQGKAIDFTYGGRAIGTRSSPGYKWLAANASSYGFYNLPSEPWHWSTNGN